MQLFLFLFGGWFVWGGGVCVWFYLAAATTVPAPLVEKAG